MESTYWSCQGTEWRAAS